MPESTAHHAAALRIYSLLAAWAGRVRGERSLRVAQNLAVRWLEQHPQTGIDPDVCVLEPGPADFEDLSSLRLWEPGRSAPRLAIEVASASHPYKDYAAVHERYAAMGAEELLVFDPLLVGPRALGGPVSLQLWQRDATNAFDRVHFGNHPVHSAVLDAWFIADGRTLHIADDGKGRARWLTPAEQLETAQAQAEHAQAQAEHAQAEAERERHAREDVERRLRELEGRLADR